MASQFDRIMAELTQIRRTQAKVHTEIRYILDWVQDQVNLLDEDSLQLGIDEPVTVGQGQDPAEAWAERVVGDESPRQRLPYKTNDGGEAFVEWNSLDEEMQKAVEFARVGDEPWQLYEGGDGEIRIGISSLVANQLRAWKLGNQTGR